MTDRCMKPIVIPDIDLGGEAEKQRRLTAALGGIPSTVSSPLTVRKIRLADAVRAVGASREAIRHWLRRLPLHSDAPAGGWREHSVIDIATLAIVAKLIDFGMRIEEAGEFANRVVQNVARPLLRFKNTPTQALAAAFADQVAVAWKTDGEWHVHLDSPNEEPPASAYAVVVLGEVVGEALDRLEGGDHA